MDGAKITVEYLEGQEKTDMQDYIDGLEIVIDSMEPVKMALGGVMGTEYLNKMREKLKKHSDKFDKSHIKKALNDAHKRLSVHAKNAKTKIDYQIEEKKFQFVLDYLKKYAGSPKLSRSEKTDIMEARSVLLDTAGEVTTKTTTTIKLKK